MWNGLVAVDCFVLVVLVFSSLSLSVCLSLCPLCPLFVVFRNYDARQVSFGVEGQPEGYQGLPGQATRCTGASIFSRGGGLWKVLGRVRVEFRFTLVAGVFGYVLFILFAHT